MTSDNNLVPQERYEVARLLLQYLGELRQPLRMRRPGRGGDQIAVDVRLIDADLRIMTAAEPHLRRAGRVGAAGAAFQHSGRRQQLRAVANGGDRFFAASNACTSAITSGFRRRYSGARPPGIKSAS